MRRVTLREMKNNTTAVLDWVSGGESASVLKRRNPVAILSPPPHPKRHATPDYAGRLQAIYGTKVLETTGSELMAESRGHS